MANLTFDEPAKIIEDVGAGADIARIVKSPEVGSEPPRLLLVSSRAKSLPLMTRAFLPNVTMVQYSYDTYTLDGILGIVAQALCSKKVEAIGLVFHCSGGQIFICANGEKVLSSQNIIEQEAIRSFFATLIQNHLDTSWINARLDFLQCTAADMVDSGLIAREIETLSFSEITVGMFSDLTASGTTIHRVGVDDDKDITVGELYFNMSLIATSAKTKIPQSAANYEKIRLVGKGAFGSAVLYRRKDDESLVIIKEINMLDLNAQCRQLALNEVTVLSKLEHPNIISYYDSFEDDGVLMIEMEYAEGGTLSQFLARRERPMEEKEILVLFNQMSSAVRYLHENNIIHRDLKTANIFMTKDGIIKIGDFGISKVMDTIVKQQGANTVIGTPYYISPEICEGKPYNEKSDIWALGCILYEMACLQKPFDGSNVAAMVNKIVTGHYEPLRGNYSTEFKHLMKDLLLKDPALRPTAQQLVTQKLSQLLSRYEDHAEADWIDAYSSSTNGSGSGCKSRKPKTRSVLYTFDPVKLNLTPVDLPIKVKIRQIAVSNSHQLVVTSEKMVYGWGDNSCGQLGVGDAINRSTPCLIEVLTGKSVAKLAAGNGFSVFCSDNGLVMSCGKAAFTGLKNLEADLVRPKLVDSLLSIDVLTVACGPEHTAVITDGGKVYAWGVGAQGRLGTGSEDFETEPVLMKNLPLNVMIREIRCGRDGTILITDSGTIYASGANKYNKLGLNKRCGYFSQAKATKTEVDKTLTPIALKSFGCRVVDVSMGVNHTAVLLESGHVHTFGWNSEGQLGKGHRNWSQGPVAISAMDDKTVIMIQCGQDFTLAGTSENLVYFWGTRRKSTSRNTSAQFGYAEIMNNRLETIHSVSVQPDGLIEDYALRNEEVTHPFVPMNEPPAPVTSAELDASSEYTDTLLLSNNTKSDVFNNGNKSEAMKIKSDSIMSQQEPQLNNSLNSTTSQFQRVFRRSKHMEREKSLPSSDSSCALLPTQVLRLDTSSSQYGCQSICLGMIVCCGWDIFVVVETTAPLPKTQRHRHKKSQQPVVHRERNVSNNVVKEVSIKPSTSDLETDSTTADRNNETQIPTWIKKELNDAEVLMIGGLGLTKKLNKAEDAEPLIPAKDKKKDKQDTSSSSPDSEATRKKKKTGRRSQHGTSKSNSALSDNADVEKLQKEKQETEARLMQVEEEYKKQQDFQEKAKIREEELEKRIEELRIQLKGKDEQAKQASTNGATVVSSLAIVKPIPPSPTKGTVVTKSSRWKLRLGTSKLCIIS